MSSLRSSVVWSLSLSVAVAGLALAPGCSALFGGSRYTGGAGGEDAGANDVGALPDTALDAPPLEPDAWSIVDASVPCSARAQCGLDEYCDLTLMRCTSCDADLDGLPAQECGGGLFYDCEPTVSPEVRSVGLIEEFQDTLRVFGVGGQIFVLHRDNQGAKRLALPGDTMPRALTYSTGFGTPQELEQFDAIRTPDGIVVTGYDADNLFRLALTGMGFADGPLRALVSIADRGFPSLRPSGPLTLLSATPDVAYVGFSATWGGLDGRLVTAIGADHVARFHDQAASPTDARTASGNGAAIVPTDEGAAPGVYLWGGDVRDYTTPSERLLPVPDPPFSSSIGQVALAVGEPRSGVRNIVAGLAGPGAESVHVALVRCGEASTDPCASSMSADYALAESERVVALSMAPGSGTTALLFTSRPAAFVVSLIDLELAGAGTITLPAVPAPLIELPVPRSTAAAGALAMDVVLDTTATPPRARLVLARAALRQIQVVEMEACLQFP